MFDEFRSIHKEVLEGKIKPVYFFYGEEPYPIDYLVKCIIEQLLDPSTRDFNFDTFDGENADMDHVIAIARSYPMMGERRLVIVRAVQQLTPSDRNRLLEYIRIPMESTCMILLSNKADRRQKFWATLAENSICLESKSLYENQAVDWVLQQIKNKHVQITHEAAQVLVQYTGISLWNLSHEIEKLITFNWGKSQITQDDVLSVAGLSRAYNVWEFTDAVAGRNTYESLHILSRLMDSKQSPVGLIMDLTRRLLILIRLNLYMEQCVPREQMGKYLQLKPYFLKLYLEQAQQFTLHEAQQAINTLYQADLAIKTGLLDPIMAMTLVVYEITKKKATRFFYS